MCLIVFLYHILYPTFSERKTTTGHNQDCWFVQNQSYNVSTLQFPNLCSSWSQSSFHSIPPLFSCLHLAACVIILGRNCKENLKNRKTKNKWHEHKERITSDRMLCIVLYYISSERRRAGCLLRCWITVSYWYGTNSFLVLIIWSWRI